MRIFNVVLGSLVDAILFPFRALPPIAGLAVLSVLTGIIVLLVVRATSNQERVTQVKRRIAAGIFEIRLFNDDPRAIVRAQMDILRYTFRYVGFTLVPLLWMIVPLTLLIIQLDAYYRHAGVQPGVPVLVKVKFSNAPAPAPNAMTLEADAGIEVQTPLLSIPSLREGDWRIAAAQAGQYELRIRIGDQLFTKQLLVGETNRRIAPIRGSSRFVDQLLNPVEHPLPANSPIEAISITYGGRTIGFLFWEMHWLVIYFVLTMATALLLQRRFNVSL